MKWRLKTVGFGLQKQEKNCILMHVLCVGKDHSGGQPVFGCSL